VTISVNTPYPGTESWHTASGKVQTRDYRLFDIQHAVLPTRLPLAEFYEELVKTQQVLNTKHLGWAALKTTATLAAGHLMRGQTNFIKMLWKFKSVYNPKLQMADHQRPVSYHMALPPPLQESLDSKLLYILPSKGRRGRALDDSAEQFVETTRMGSSL
jgi:hopanoid C-3 methylase